MTTLANVTRGSFRNASQRRAPNEGERNRAWPGDVVLVLGGEPEEVEKVKAQTRETKPNRIFRSRLI